MFGFGKKKAADFADNALQLDGTIAPAWMFKAMSLSQMGRNDHALNAIAKAAVLKSDSPGVWNNRGEILVLLNQFDEARSAFDRALEIDAECAAAWFGRGRLSCFQGKHENALEDFECYFKLAPKEGSLMKAAEVACKLSQKTMEPGELRRSGAGEP